jgi:hypothetical protein
MVVKPGVINNWDLMEEQVQFYRDHLDIFIEDAFAPIKLTKRQHVIARMFGRTEEGKVVCSRGFGKTFLIMLCCAAFCCLYPGTLVAVCSGTAAQATLVFSKLKLVVEQNKNVANELQSNSAKNYVQLAKDKGKCTFKNGSVMESFALESMRGLRAKIIVVDEALEMDQGLLDSIVSPIRNYRRDISFNYDFKDYPSKFISITSATEKSNSFYDGFKRTVRDMVIGKPGSFACALDYHAAIEDGITDAEFFEAERAKMPASVFDMEYGSIFQGSVSNSAFPYDLTDPCRTLSRIETEQPKNSKSRYVISLDIATSEAKIGDNSIISVVKFTEHSDGTFAKKLVNMRSYHGKGLDTLANEIRIIYHKRFPNAERIIYDARGLGDSFAKFLDEPWTDPETGKEYPPLTHDDEPRIIPNAEPVLHAIRAVQTLNQRMASNLRVMLEKRTLELPMSSRAIQANRTNAEKETQKLKPEEMAVFYEADALQDEMGNVICKVSTAGHYIYDTPRLSMHKDRYSSLAMACDYIAEIEKENVKSKSRGPVCIGIASRW